jgi:tripartite-type tricarboxylate transporter receptor subunit TctC
MFYIPKQERKKIMKKIMLIVLLFTFILSFSVVVAKAEYPDKPITYIISFNPGGESDITARLQEKHLEEVLGVPVNVTHQPGGGGAVAWGQFQRTAKPDGYSLIGVNIPHIIGQPLQRKDAGYKTDGFNLIMWFHFTPNALIVRKDSKFNTVKDFVDFAKKNPKVVTVGGSGTYSANHLETLRLEREAGIKLTYIPHTGTGPLVPAVLGGHLTALMNYSMLGVQLKEQVRVLAMASEERVPFLPDAPTFREQGYDIVGGAFRGVAAPIGTDKKIIDKLAQAFTKVNKTIAKKQEPLGFVMTYATGDKAQALVEQMKKAYGDVFRDIAKKGKK